jgi:hypothetical protein
MYPHPSPGPPPRTGVLPEAGEYEESSELLYYYDPPGAVERHDDVEHPQELCVHLCKHESVLSTEFWRPTKFWVPRGYGGKSSLEMTPDDLELATLRAYSNLLDSQRMGELSEVDVQVSLPGFPTLVHVVMEKHLFTYKQAVWRDSTGRIW